MAMMPTIETWRITICSRAGLTRKLWWIKVQPSTSKISAITISPMSTLTSAGQGRRWNRDNPDSANEGEVAAPEAPKRTVYVLVDGRPAPRQVTAGITDGRVTEITGGDLKEGDNVIVSIAGQNPNQQRGGQGQRPNFRIL